MKANVGKSSKRVNFESPAAEVATFRDEEAIFGYCKKSEVMRVGFESKSQSAVSESKSLRVFVFKFKSVKKKL